MVKIMLVDDDKSFLRVYSKILSREGYDVLTCENGDHAVETFKKNHVDIVISDVIMPKMNGIELLKEIKKNESDIQIIMLSGKGNIKDAVEAMKLGAYNYLLKPVDIEELLINIKKALNLKNIGEENYIYRNEKSELFKENRIIGKSDHINEIKSRINAIADVDSTVLIMGETGTGKEIVAQEIHYNSKRRDKPLIKVNCAALAKTVLESELFGHERGAFTGAFNLKKGKFELAHGGTIFLDEIGELPIDVQVKLLRVLQEKEFERVGGIKTIKADFRLITATNKDLKKEVEEGRFREDLFYRLNVIPIYLKPLRERKEDILPLAEYFLKKYSKELNRNVKGFDEQALKIINHYDWPGNVRELKNIIERCVVFCKRDKITPEEIPQEIKSKTSMSESSKPLKKALDEFEKQYIISSLNENNWNIKQTSEKIGIARKNLYEKIRKYRIKKPKSL
jgi:DNA-binding NtrC family response regulator